VRERDAVIRAIVTVDGIDGSGKSMFAKRVEAAFAAAGVATAMVRVDDFRREVAWAADGLAEADIYYDRYYDLAMCDQVLRTFMEGGGAVEIPAWDNAADRNVGTRTIDLSASVVIVEGVFPRRMPTIESGLGIYLATSEDEARRRILERDQKKGRSEAEVTRRIDHRYFPTQRRYHAQFSPQERADVLVDNERPDAPRIVRKDLSRLPPELRPILDEMLGPPTG
jgi:uridine kinase